MTYISVKLMKLKTTKKKRCESETPRDQVLIAPERDAVTETVLCSHLWKENTLSGKWFFVLLGE